MIDWAAVERSPEFVELAARRRRFVVPALVGAALLYGTFLVLAAYRRDLMAASLYRGVSVAFASGAVVIAGVGLIALLYVRYANRTLTELTERVRNGAGRADR